MKSWELMPKYSKLGAYSVKYSPMSCSTGGKWDGRKITDQCNKDKKEIKVTSRTSMRYCSLE